MPEVLLSLKGVTKNYGPLRVNDRIDWTVNVGEIHALIGENGAGKSTLMKILFGLETADAGEIFWKGQRQTWSSALNAKSHGIAMVHQHFMQAENMTALEHFALESSTGLSFWKRLRPLDWSAILQQAQALSDEYQLQIPWHKPVLHLSVGEQQRLEILKALSHRAELLILDEPTAVLSPQEVDPFLDRLSELKKRGMTIILITHKLKEVLRIADRISVLRKGKLVWSGPRQDQNQQSLAEQMVGEDLHALGPLANSDPHADLTPAPSAAPPFLQMKVTGGIRLASPMDAQESRTLGQWNFSVQRGEILGLAGVDGNGQEDVVDLLIHPRRFELNAGSEVLLESKSLLSFSEAEVRASGRAWIPSDRLNQAAILQFSARENFLLGREYESCFSTAGLLHWRETENHLQQGIQELDIRPPRTDLALSSYSGGNQQKVIAAREFGRRPRWICACHPTRGIDIMAARRLHAKLLDFKKDGVTTLLLSADLDELFLLCDRILVFYRGEIIDQIQRKDYDTARVGRAMAGLT